MTDRRAEDIPIVAAPDARSHFQSGGADYARFRPRYPAALASALAGVAPDRRAALDVGCGTGQLSCLLAEHFESVVALDVSADQIAHATPHPRVTYRLGEAETLAVPQETISLVTVAQAAHWFDLPRFYGAARRVAAPGAVLALVSYGVMVAEPPLAERLDRFYWHEIGPHWPPERRHVETGYADLPFPFDALAPPTVDIVHDWPFQGFAGYIGTWSAVKRARAAGSGDLVDRFLADAAALWGDPDQPRRLRWPIRMRLGRIGG